MARLADRSNSYVQATTGGSAELRLLSRSSSFTRSRSILTSNDLDELFAPDENAAGGAAFVRSRSKLEGLFGGSETSEAPPKPEDVPDPEALFAKNPKSPLSLNTGSQFEETNSFGDSGKYSRSVSVRGGTQPVPGSTIPITGRTRTETSRRTDAPKAQPSSPETLTTSSVTASPERLNEVPNIRSEKLNINQSGSLRKSRSRYTEGTTSEDDPGVKPLRTTGKTVSSVNEKLSAMSGKLLRKQSRSRNAHRNLPEKSSVDRIRELVAQNTPREDRNDTPTDDYGFSTNPTESRAQPKVDEMETKPAMSLSRKLSRRLGSMRRSRSRSMSRGDGGTSLSRRLSSIVPGKS